MKIFTLLLLNLAFLFSVSASNDQQKPKYARVEKTVNAIEYGQKFALALLQGNEQELVRIDASFDKKKFEEENGPLRQLTSGEINQLREKNIHLSLIAPLTYNNQKGAIQLFSLQRNKSFVVMAFKVLNSEGTFVEIPKVGPMVAVVSLRHQIDPKKEQDYWSSIFYDFSFSFYDYYSWLAKYGQKATEEILSKGSQFMETFSYSLNSKTDFEKLQSDMMGNAKKELSGLYEWVVSTQERMMADALGDSPLGKRFTSKVDSRSRNSNQSTKKDNK